MTEHLRLLAKPCHRTHGALLQSVSQVFPTLYHPFVVFAE